MKPSRDVQPFIDMAKKVTDLKSLEKAVAKLQESPSHFAGRTIKVHGTVVEGSELVKKIESYGTSSGKTKGKITIQNSGQL